LASEYLHGVLGNLLLLIFLISSIIAVVSGLFLLAINRHRNHIKAIDEACAEIELCSMCLKGNEPASCPIPALIRPENCPKRKQGKRMAALGRIRSHIDKEPTDL
jgi:hypothetical protein